MKALIILLYVIVTRLASFMFSVVVLLFSFTFIWEMIRPTRRARQGG